MSESEAPERKLERRPSFSKRVRGRLHSLLPKVSRARSKSVTRLSTQKTFKRKPSRVVNVKEPKEIRQPPPPLTKNLESILSGDFILYLGENFIKRGNAVKDKDMIRRVLAALKEFLPEEAEETRATLDMKLSNTEAADVLGAYDLLRDYYGTRSFIPLFRDQLLLAYQNVGAVNDTLPLKLLKAINSRFIFYEGFDTALEEQFQFDNVKMKVMTYDDLLSYSIQNDVKALIEESKKQRILVKLNGSIKNPESLQISKVNRFESIGLTTKSIFIEPSLLSADVSRIKEFLCELLDALPTVFLGCPMKFDHPMVGFLSALHNAKKIQDVESDHDNEETAEIPVAVEVDPIKKPFSNVAFVKEIPNEDLERPIPEDIRTEYIRYKPDKTNSQFDEFLVQVAAFCSARISTDIAPFSIARKAYLQKLNSAEFVESVAMKESQATQICIFKTNPKQVQCCGGDPLMEEILLKFAKRSLDSPEHVARFMQSIALRYRGYAEIANPSLKAVEENSPQSTDAEEQLSDTNVDKDIELQNNEETTKDSDQATQEKPLENKPINTPVETPVDNQEVNNSNNEVSNGDEVVSPDTGNRNSGTLNTPKAGSQDLQSSSPQPNVNVESTATASKPESQEKKQQSNAFQPEPAIVGTKLDIGEPLEAGADELPEHTIVRILFTTKGIEDFAKTRKEYGIGRVANLVDLIDSSNGRFSFRVVNSSVADEVAQDFEILYLQGENGVGDTCLIEQSNRKDFTVNWFSMNSNETEEKAMFYERLWNSAKDEATSMRLLRESIPKARESAKKAAEELTRQAKEAKAKQERKASSMSSMKNSFKKPQVERKLSKNKIKAGGKRRSRFFNTMKVGKKKEDA